ncbi:MAG: insulinase family protein [Erythrobacter sp.]|uniref:M16 family metallopeptidase n=1 Tax=Erythrobacter sp. TaxID=1042 RepID=UPI00260E9DE8|nr:M16 family metallopeptidase [Erythrobacter sp.]MDJ0977006.1 insulinase family protein [Erythrobacter sp.]
MITRIHLLVASLFLALSNSVLVHSLAAQNHPDVEARAERAEPTWAFETSDIEVDPGYTFGELDNGMRYILRQNATPEGTALVRMRIGSGSLEETDTERGLAHYLEHMAFNGSTGIPEGEMIKLLERKGLAFGADTNAGTGLDSVTYMLNLPRNDEDLLDTALMLMRETASELTIAEDAVERERGVILAERRDRRNYQQRAQEDGFEFYAPEARFAERLPIGTLDVIESASSETIRALYERTYVPDNTVIVIVGDYPVEMMEAKLRERFASWTGPSAPEEPVTGPVDITQKGLTDIYTDPSLSESVSIVQFGEWRDEPDTIANRKRATLRGIGYAIVNRRLARLARAEDAPFRGANFSQGNFFEDARTTGINVASVDGAWREGVLAAVQVYNEALTYGFTQAEVDEQLARRRSALENAVKAKDTRNNAAFVGAALSLVGDEIVPTTPEHRLELFETFAPEITPKSVYAAFKEHVIRLDDPLIRFQGREAPEGGEDALRSAFRAGMALPITPPTDNGSTQFAYTDFGKPGAIVTDTAEEQLGIRQVVFDNAVRLNLKTTDIREDRISVSVSIDGGNLMSTREDPLAVYLASSLSAGGLGAHSVDELSTILAGRSVGFGLASNADSFVMSATTTPRDLDLQMQLFAALLTDPGYRAEGVEQFRKGIKNFFETLRSTPSRALSAVQGRELSDADPRFTLQPQDAFKALDYDGLEAVIGDRLANGAIEIAIVGDVEEDAAIAAVASTFGALPERENAFRPRDEARSRGFTQDRSTRVIEHDGEADQALLRMFWPATDDTDFEETVRLQMLGRVLQLELIDRIREELGQAYSPGASVNLSHHYRDYGTILINVALEDSQIEEARAAIAAMLADLAGDAITEDLLERARKPLLEKHENALKGLGGYAALTARAQSEPERIDRYFAYPDTLKAVSVEDVRAAAAQYLKPEAAVTFIVAPSEAAKAKATAEFAEAGGRE